MERATAPRLESEFLRRAEAARMLRVSLGTLDQWTRRRLISVIRPGGRVVLYRRSAIIAALQRFEVQAIGDPKS